MHVFYPMCEHPMKDSMAPLPASSPVRLRPIPNFISMSRWLLPL